MARQLDAQLRPVAQLLLLHCLRALEFAGLGVKFAHQSYGPLVRERDGGRLRSVEVLVAQVRSL